MALGAQNQQLSLQLILSAQDEASAKIKAVGEELQKLGKGVSLTGLSEGVKTSLTEVTAAIKAAGRERQEEARAVAQQDLASLRTDLREREQAIKQSFAAQAQAEQHQFQQQVQAQRDATAKNIQQERTSRDEMLRDARAYFDQAMQLQRTHAAQALQLARVDEQDATVMARAALGQRLRDLEEEQQQELARVKKTSAEMRAVLAAQYEARGTSPEQFAQRRAQVAAGFQARGMAPEEAQQTAATLVNYDQQQQTARAQQMATALTQHDQEAQTQAVLRGTAERSAAAHAEAQQVIAAARTRVEQVAALGADEMHILRDNLAQALVQIRTLYDQRVSAVEEGLRKELERIKTLTGDATMQYNRAAQDAIAAAREEVAGIERVKTAGLQRVLATMQAQESQQVAAERTAGERMLAESQRIAQEQARVAKAGGPLGMVLETAQGHLKRFGGAVETMSGAVTKSFGPLEKFLTFARMMVVWQVGYTALSAVLGGLGRLATGLITTNTSFEQTTKTFQAFYGRDAPAVVAWLDRFAETTPATREEVRQAGLTVAALGDNMGKAMPALENLASVMGKDLPTAAQAFSDAQQGRFEMMQISMRTTKQELINYGLQVDNVGHIMNNSFVPAFERYVQTRFGEHVAYDAQQVAKASAALAGAGAPTTGKASVMPALEYGASMMGVKNLSDATGAYAQAMQSNLKPLESMFDITTAELVKQGLVIGANGQIVSGTLAPAFAKVIALDFGGHIGAATAKTSAMQDQMQTLAGAFSNLQDVMTTLQRVLGQGIFDVLKTSLIGTLNVLQAPVWLSWAHRTGEEMGKMVRQAADGMHRLWVQIGGIPGVMRLMGNAVQQTQSVLKGLGDTLHVVWSMLGFLGGTIRAAIGLFTNMTGIGRGTNDMTRTMVAVVGDAYIAWKVLGGTLGLAEGALKLWNLTGGKAITALKNQKAATDAQKAAQVESTAATKLGAEAETTLAAQTTVAKDAQIAAKTTTQGLTLATGELATAETGAALATGELGAAEVLATTRTGIFGGALTLLSGGLSGLKGVLMATLGPIGLWVAAIALGVVAVKQLADAYDVLENKMDPAAQKQVKEALTPTGTVGQPAVPGGQGYLLSGPNAGTYGTMPGAPAVAATGDVGPFIEYLKHRGAVNKEGPAKGQTDAYWAYARMIETNNPDYWIAYLRKHTNVEKRYLAMMDKEGRGDVARQILAGTSPLLAQGDTATALDPATMLKQQYQKALATFQWARTHDPASALADLQDVQAEQVSLLEAQGKSVNDALTMAQAHYKQLLDTIPAAYRTDQSGSYLPASTQGDQTVPAKTAKQYGSDLAAFKKTRWAAALDAVRAGTISATDLTGLVSEYETLQTEAGVPVTDTKIQDQIKTALKTRVSHMLAKFNADLKRALAGTLPGGQRALEDEISQIQTVEAQAGMTDYTDYEGKITAAFAKKTKAAAEAQIKPLVTQFTILFYRLKHHVRGVTASAVENLITQIQGIEVGAGLADTTGIMSQHVQDFLASQQTREARTQATSTYQQYKGEYDQAIARFHAEAKKEPDVARGMIPGIQEDVVQMAYARTKNWSFAIAEGKAAVTKLNAEIDRATGGIKGLSNAEDKYKDDLASLGRSSADRKRLMDDANKVYQLELHGGMNRNKAHAEYEAHIKQIDAHMKATGTLPGIAQPYHAYGGLASSAGYGSVTASFGMPSTMTSILLAQLAESRRQTHYWQQQDAHDKQVIASLQAQLVVGRESVGMLRDIRGGILSAATPTAQRSVHSHLRNAGGSVPITNP